MTSNPFQFNREFVRERCDFCGLCFSECPVLQLPRDTAQNEIRRLVEQGYSYVTHHCTGCMACNSICPQHADPHTLIVSTWRKRYESRGLPARARLVLPYHKKNLHATGITVLPEREKALVRQWEENWRNPPQCDTMLFTGCNMLLLPFFLDSPVYADIPIFGSLSLCCGEPFYRMGCWDAAAQVAHHVCEAFARMNLSTIVVPCLACYHLFNYVYPRVFGVAMNIRFITIEAWILHRIKTGRISISPINKTAVLHDHCWPKASGETLFNEIRELLELLGVTVAEAEHSKENALCCGMCAAAARYRLRDSLHAGRRLLQELEMTPSDLAVEYCGGCTWLLSLINQVLGNRYRKPRYHVLELVQWATGELPGRHTEFHMRRIAYRMGLRLGSAYMNPKRFFVNNIELS